MMRLIVLQTTTEVTSAARKLVVQVVKYNHGILKEKPNLSISLDLFYFTMHP
jgi:hypothetical protein